MTRTTGTYENTTVVGGEIGAFVPHPLPPYGPQLDMSPALKRATDRAEAALARLELAGAMVPSVDWLIYSFVRKEAVLSSQIEGTQATLIDLLTYEADSKIEVEEAHVEKVCNYVDALGLALTQLDTPRGLPISMRLLNRAHGMLLKGARGSGRSPGKVRRSQNWIGGTRPGNAVFVPPPPHRLEELLTQFERYIHAEDDLAPLLRAGLLHVQFETIHPYLDGNGRIGRLLVTVLLLQWGLLSRPLLYLSLFFRRHQGEYYRRLGAVRTEGDFEGWLEFFLEGIAVVAEEATGTIQAIYELVTTDRSKVLAGRSTSVSAARLFELLPEHPVVTLARTVSLLETTKPTASKAIKALVDVGVLVESTGKRRDRAYNYSAYLDLLRTGTELEE